MRGAGLYAIRATHINEDDTETNVGARLRIGTRRKKFWIVLACSQAIGVISLPFANVHSNGLAFLLMIVLLFPGLEVAALFAPDDLPVLIPIAVAFNVLFWYGALLAISKLKSRRRS